MKDKIKVILKKSNFINYLNIKLYWYRINKTKNIPDEDYAKEYYYNYTGETLNLENPITFNEKLWYLKLYNKDPLLTVCSDKLKVRDYVEDLGLGHILNPLYDVYTDALNIDFDNLPHEQIFLKTNHTSGYNALFDKNKAFDKKYFIKKFNFILKQNYFYVSREWNYKNIEPRIISEKVFESEGLLDYRFFCFNGEVKMVFIDSETINPDGTHFKGARRNIYDRDLNFQDFTVHRENFPQEQVKKPDNYEEMVRYAEILSKPFPFARVDLYNIKGKILFGEITFYPGGAVQKFSSEEWAEKMGSWIDLSLLNNNSL